MYNKFKRSFIKYLFYGFEKSDILESLEIYIADYVELLYERHDEEVWTPHLLLRTCNRIIEYLTTETQGKPSRIFSLLAIQGECLTLAVILLKIICKNSYIHLEASIGYLIQYYENQSESDCQWLITFLETLKLIMTIYAENIRYNLVSIEANQPKVQTSDNFNSYRIFSQVKREQLGIAVPLR
jgi:hypothetical protein